MWETQGIDIFSWKYLSEGRSVVFDFKADLLEVLPHLRA
jgi:hypothetical protein